MLRIVSTILNAELLIQ